MRFPQNQRLIPIEVFEHSAPRAAAQFGFELGTGVRTYLPGTPPYAVAALIVLAMPQTGLLAIAVRALVLDSVVCLLFSRGNSPVNSVLGISGSPTHRLDLSG